MKKKNDMQMIMASQIAYIDFDKEAVKSGKYTVGELLDVEASKGNEKAILLNKRLAETPGVSDCRNWKLVDIRDDNQKGNILGSGMYGCLIETGDRDAIVAFRGSESDGRLKWFKDWIVADLGLLNNESTLQQKMAKKYMSDIYKKYGNKYDSFDVTGHSLGGNLAEHATITAPDGMKEKINRCVSLDGPGFSNKYIEEHQKEISSLKKNIDHYQWSIIGSLLNPIEGTNYVTVAANTPDDKGSELWNAAWRHETTNVICDENGNFKAGKRDWLVEKLDPISQTIDLAVFLSSLMFNLVETLITGRFDQFIDQFRKTWEKWQDIIYSHMDAQFEIRPSIVERNTDELWDVEKKLNAICAEVQEIQGKLAFNSVSAGCLKMKLWTISNGIESDTRKLTNYAKAGRECCEHYRYNENNIADMYAS